MHSSLRAGWPTQPWSGWVRCSTEDVCVPVTKVPAMLQRIEAIAVKHDVLIANIAHAGDGNLHPLLITAPGDDAARVRAQEAFAKILVEALALGGTVTGEHGVGLTKRDGLAAELCGRRRHAPGRPSRPQPLRDPESGLISRNALTPRMCPSLSKGAQPGASTGSARVPTSAPASARIALSRKPFAITEWSGAPPNAP